MNRFFTVSVIVISTLLATGCSTKVSRSGNPLFPGWYADPEATIFGNKYWVYPTYSDVYEKQVFMDAFSSRDLVKWEKHERILDTSNVKWARRALWAPATVKNGDKYYIFFAANDIQNNAEYGGIGVAVSDKPEGPFIDLLGKPLISQFHNGAQPIDQFVFQDKDGKWYIYYGGWRHCNVARLKPDFTGFIPFEDGTIFKEVTPENYVEGPVMFIKDNKYYFMWSEGGWTGPNYKVAYAISDNPFGPFKRESTILQQDFKIANGAGHHSIIQSPSTKKWYIVYHRRPNTEKSGNSRETCIEELHFDADGKIKPIVITTEGVAKDKIKK